MTEPTGTFDDGSGGDNYADDQNNWIRVSPCEADAIPCQVLLYFSEFDVTGGDYLYIHDGVEPPPYMAPCTTVAGEVVDADTEAACTLTGNTYAGGLCTDPFGTDVEAANQANCEQTGNSWSAEVVVGEAECQTEPTGRCMAAFTAGAAIDLGPAEPVPGEAAPDPLPFMLRSTSPTIWLHWVSDPFFSGPAQGFTAHYRTDSPHDGRLNENGLIVAFPVVTTAGASLELTPPFSPARLAYTAVLPPGGTPTPYPFPYVDPIPVPDNPYDVTSVTVTATWPTEIEPPWVPFNVTYPADRAGEQLGGISVFVNGQPYEPGIQVNLDNGLTLQPLVISVRAMDQYTYWDYIIMCSPFGADIENITTVGSLELATPPLPPVHVVGGDAGWVAQVNMPEIYDNMIIEMDQGDILRFNFDMIGGATPLGGGVRLMDGPGCPADYENHGELLNHDVAAGGTHEDEGFHHDRGVPPTEGFEVEVDTNGTFYFAGSMLTHCMLGQRLRVDVSANPRLGAAPNTPEEAPLITTRNVYGSELAVHDRPRVTATQWDHGVPYYSISGWDGFHEWFKFDVHQGETTHLAVQFREDVYFATGMLWDEEYTPLAILTPTPEANAEGVREFHFNWLAPVTGIFWVSVRTFVRDGAPYGNYSMAYYSDWEDMCVTQAFDCGAHGACEMVEEPAGVYTPFCACRERWKGDQCEIEPPPAVTLVLRAQTTIMGATTPDNFKEAIAALDDGLDPYMVEIFSWPQKLTATVELPGDVRDFDQDTAAGQAGRLQFITALEELLPDACLEAGPDCPAGIVIDNVVDYLTFNGLRKARPVTADTFTLTVNGDIADVGAEGSPEREAYTNSYISALSAYTAVQEERIEVISIVGASVAITTKFLENEEGASGTSVADAIFLLENEPPSSLGSLIVSSIDMLPLVGSCAPITTAETCGAQTASDSCAAVAGCRWSDGGTVLAPENCAVPDECTPEEIAEVEADDACLNEAYYCALVGSINLGDLETAEVCELAGSVPGGCAWSKHPHALEDRPASCTGVAADTEATPNCAAAFEAADEQTMNNCPLGCTFEEEFVAPTGRRRAQMSDDVRYIQDGSRRRMQVPDDVDIRTEYWPNPDHIDCYPYRCYDPTCMDGDTSSWGPWNLNCAPLQGGAAGSATVTGGLVEMAVSALGGGNPIDVVCAQDVYTNGVVGVGQIGPPAGSTLADYCPASCGTCTPYLGGPGVIVQFTVLSNEDISGTVMASDFAQQFASALNAAGDSIWGGKPMTAAETNFVDFLFETIADYTVTMVKDSEEENAMIANAMDNGLKHDGGLTFARVINATGGVAYGSGTGQVQGESGAARQAAITAIQLMRDSAVQSALAADGDVVPVLWYGVKSDVSGLPGSATQDMVLRGQWGGAGETQDAQLLAQQAAEQLIMAGDGMGGNFQTTVERAASAAEHAAGMVLGMVMTPNDGEGIPDGFVGGSAGAGNGNTYVHDVSRGGHYVPADFTQYGDFSQAAVAAAASAAAARLVAEGADDAHPLTNDADLNDLENLDPILSQAPSSQAFSDDPQLPSSTSRFSAQTDWWWIPDYLPGGRPPEQPKPPVITRYTDREVELRWDPPYDWGIPIRGYEIEYRSCDIFYATQKASECDGWRSGYEHAFPTHYGTHTTHEIMQLQPGKMYFFHVRAYNIFDQYMNPNNYGVWSYDSLAVTLWRVPDKMSPPIPHQTQCHEPWGAKFEENDWDENTKLYDIETTVEGTVPGAGVQADAIPTSARANCSIHLTWTTPFSGAVENPLIDHTDHPYDRRVDIHNNDIVNYRIFYHATQTAYPVYPEPDMYWDLNGTLWREIPHPPDLRYCVSDYSFDCPDGWDYGPDPSDPSSGLNVCSATDPLYVPAEPQCNSPQNFADFDTGGGSTDKEAWELACGEKWKQVCQVRTEFTVYGLQDSTDYFFIITAINMGGPGAINAPYHPSAGYGAGAYPHGEVLASHHGSAQHEEHFRGHGEYSGYTGAGYIRNRPAHKLYGLPDCKETSPPGGRCERAIVKRQYYGEGDFSESSAVAPKGNLNEGDRVMARDVLGQIPELPGHYITNVPYVAKYPGPDPQIALAPGYVPVDPADISVLTTVEPGNLAGHRRQRPMGIDLAFVDPFYKPMAGPNVHPLDQTAWFRTEPCDNALLQDETNSRCRQLGDVGYFPATVTKVDPYDLSYEITFDALCPDLGGGPDMPCVDPSMPESSIRQDLIYPLGQGSNNPAVTTWRVPDAPMKPYFGEVLATSIEVKWYPPPFDGNTNHENFAKVEGVYDSDPAYTTSGGIVYGYRLFMQRYEQETGMKEEWIEIMGVREIGTNTTFVVTDLDSDVNYIFTVVAHNIVGDSAHSLEAMSPPTMDAPIPEDSVNIKMRPVCPSMQPKKAEHQVPWLVCNNIPSSLFAITSGGGTNAEFDYVLYREESERKCDPINCQPETKDIKVIVTEPLYDTPASCTGVADDGVHDCTSANFAGTTDVLTEEAACLSGAGAGCTFVPSALRVVEAFTGSEFLEATCSGKSTTDPLHDCANEFAALATKTNTPADCIGSSDNGCTYTPQTLEFEGWPMSQTESTCTGSALDPAHECDGPAWQASPLKELADCTAGSGEGCTYSYGNRARLEDRTVITKNLTEWYVTKREMIMPLGGGGTDCCTFAVPEDTYVLVLNTSNSRGWTTSEQALTIRRCGCMDIFNSMYDHTATHQAPWMCESTPPLDILPSDQGEKAIFHDATWAGMERLVQTDAYVHWEQHLTDSVFAVEIAILIESGAVDVYTSTHAPPDHGSVQMDPDTKSNSWETVAYNVNAADHNIVMWEHRVPFNTLLLEPDAGVRGEQYPYIDISKSLYVGVHGREAAAPYATFGTHGYEAAELQDFARYKIRIRNVKFQEERTNLPDWEATDGQVETGLYQFYELYFSESAGDVDVKVSVQCKIGNVTLFVAKKDKYPSEFRTFTQTATTPQGGVAEVIDTFKPEEDRVLFIAVRGNVGDYTEGYPNYRPYATGQIYDETSVTPWNKYIITARSYRYRGEPARLQPEVGLALDDSPFGGTEPSRYSEVTLDNFNFYSVQYSDKAWAIEVAITVQYGVVDLYSQFDIPPTQARYFQVARGIYQRADFIVPFEAIQKGIGELYFGVFGRETDYASYSIQVRELTFADAENDPVHLRNGTWHTDVQSCDDVFANCADGYRFYRSYIGPEDTPMGHTVRSGPGSVTPDLGSDPFSWGTDWTEEWVQTWSRHHRDEYDFDVFAKFTVRVYPHELPAPEPEPEEQPETHFRGHLIVDLETKFVLGTLSADEELAYLDYSAEQLSAAVAANVTEGPPPLPTAGGVSIFASLDWEYPSQQRERDMETHAAGDPSSPNVTVATLTVPVSTFFGRTIHIGVRPDISSAPYDIHMEYVVQHEDDVTSPVPKPHTACPAVVITLVNATFNTSCTDPNGDDVDTEDEAVCLETGNEWALVPTCGAGNDGSGNPCAVNTAGDACADATGDCAFQEGTCETHVKIPAAGVATGGEGARCAIEAGAFDYTGNVCEGTATAVPATCGSGTDGDGNPCAVDSAGTACAVATGACAFVAGYTPKCDLNATTDSTNVCPPGCSEFVVCTETVVAATTETACVSTGNVWDRIHIPPVLEHVECNAYGVCVDGRCICQTGYYGDDCATMQFSSAAAQPRISFISPSMHDVLNRSIIGVSFDVANRVLPNDGHVYLYVDGLPYPSAENNRLLDAADYKIHGLFRGMHTAQLVLTAADDTPLATDIVHFEVLRPGGCANHCSDHGICAERQGGQYCVCNDGWAGVDCGTLHEYDRQSEDVPEAPAGFVPGAGLVEDLRRQMEHAVSAGLQDHAVGRANLDLAMEANNAEVFARQRKVELELNSFRNQHEAEMHSTKLKHQAMLDRLYREGDRVRLKGAEQAEHNRRVTTAAIEAHHARQRGLAERQRQLQNKHSHHLRQHDMKWGLQQDRLEHANAKTQFHVEHLRHWDTSLNNINDLAQMDCDQDAYGNFECYYNNYVKDCVTGDLMMWRAGDETSKYPVKCPADPGPPPLIRGVAQWDGPVDLLRESSGRPLPVQRGQYLRENAASSLLRGPDGGMVTSERDEMGADLDDDNRFTLRTDWVTPEHPPVDGTHGLNYAGRVAWDREEYDDDFGPSPTRQPQHSTDSLPAPPWNNYGHIPGDDNNWRRRMQAETGLGKQAAGRGAPAARRRAQEGEPTGADWRRAQERAMRARSSGDALADAL